MSLRTKFSFSPKCLLLKHARFCRSYMHIVEVFGPRCSSIDVSNVIVL